MQCILSDFFDKVTTKKKIYIYSLLGSEHSSTCSKLAETTFLKQGEAGSLPQINDE